MSDPRAPEAGAGAGPPPPTDDAPPLPGGALYGIVVAVLAATIAALAWLTGHWR